jgi:hypothetical protein
MKLSRSDVTRITYMQVGPGRLALLDNRQT